MPIRCHSMLLHLLILHNPIALTNPFTPSRRIRWSNDGRTKNSAAIPVPGVTLSVTQNTVISSSSILKARQQQQPTEESLLSEDEIQNTKRDQTLRSLCSALSLSKAQAQEFLDAAIRLEQTDVMEKVAYFRTEVGMSKERLRHMISQHPNLVATVFIEDVKTTMEVLEEDLQLSPRQIRTLAMEHPFVIRYYRAELRRKLAFMRGPALRLSDDNLKKLVMKRPQLLGFSMENLGGTTGFFRYELNLYGEELGNMLVRAPYLLSYSVPNNLYPTVVYLRDEVFGCYGDIDRRREAVSATIKRFPLLLGYSLEDNLKKKVKFLKARLGVSPRELARMISTYPQMLSLSTEKNLRPKFNLFTQQLEFSREELRSVIVLTPTTLSLSLENNLKPKIQYLLKDVGLTKKQLRRLILQTPGMLSYSFESRMKPRMENLIAAGRDWDDIPAPVIGLTEKKFVKW